VCAVLESSTSTCCAEYISAPREISLNSFPSQLQDSLGSLAIISSNLDNKGDKTALHFSVNALNYISKQKNKTG